METPSPILTMSKIGKAFSGVWVLRDVSLDLYPGEVHCLVGENGAGKSTLIKIISGAYYRDEGTVTYQGQALNGLTPRWARENGISTIYQEIDLVPSLTVAENIFLGIEPLTRMGNIDRASMRQEAQRILDDMGTHINVNTPTRQLTIAYQQMVAIAKALTLQSKIIILDEPTAVFTSSEIDFLFRIIRRLKEQGLAILYISHHLDEIFEIGDRVTVLRDGQLIRTGCVEEFDKNSLVKAMVGREIDFSHQNGANTSGEPFLRVEGLRREGAVSDVDLALRKGEIVGLAGLVGAGRSELARLIIGADKPDGGRIVLDGREVHVRSPQHALRLGIGMVPEDRKLDGLVLMRSIAENLAYSLVVGSQQLGIVPWKQVKATVNRLVGDTNIRPPQPTLQVEYLSGGNQQKVVLGKWLAARSDILILDEPTRGVDVGARAEIYKLMQELKHAGKAILMISSDMTEILTQADRILVMARGRIAGELSFAEATEERVLSLALGLGDEIVERPQAV